jgi:hypothetical protein
VEDFHLLSFASLPGARRSGSFASRALCPQLKEQRKLSEPDLWSPGPSPSTLPASVHVLSVGDIIKIIGHLLIAYLARAYMC